MAAVKTKDEAIEATGDRLASAHGALAELLREVSEDEDAMRAIERADACDPGRDLAKRVREAMGEWRGASEAAMAALHGDVRAAALCGRYVESGTCVAEAGHEGLCQRRMKARS